MALDRQKILQKLIKDFDPLIASYLDSRENENESEDSEEKHEEEDESCEVEVPEGAAEVKAKLSAKLPK